MAYGYGYGGYQAPGMGAMYPPAMPDQLAQLRGQQGPFPQVQQQTPPQNGINWVQGVEGARAYMVAPGCTVLLMDSDGSSFYLKSADNSGMPQPLRIFDYVERKDGDKKPAEKETSLQSEIAALRADIDALKARCAGCSINTRQTVQAHSSAILSGSEGAGENA